MRNCSSCYTIPSKGVGEVQVHQNENKITQSEVVFIYSIYNLRNSSLA
jgi:hypothetical protein